jgi:nucleoside-triphosphatase
MPERKIYILTGAIQTGKTTALLNWSDRKKNVSGILTPVINGKRFFMDVSTKEQFEMEAAEDEKEILSTGRFNFSRAAFEKAIQTIRQSSDRPGWLIIDEIGPLELKKEGFYTVIKDLLKNHSAQLLFVVREGLPEKVVLLFELKRFQVIKKEELDSL